MLAPAERRTLGIVLVPASLIATLVELKPRGRTPLAWVYIFARRACRPRLLIATRTAGSSGQGPGTRMRRVRTGIGERRRSAYPPGDE